MVDQLAVDSQPRDVNASQGEDDRGDNSDAGASPAEVDKSEAEAEEGGVHLPGPPIASEVTTEAHGDQVGDALRNSDANSLGDLADLLLSPHSESGPGDSL